MIFPSLPGLTPRSLSRMAFSIAGNDEASYGWTITMRASGTWNDASWLIGVCVP